jgi:hypothetical protein
LIAGAIIPQENLPSGYSAIFCRIPGGFFFARQMLIKKINI